jgi:peptidoglycan-associated lipoprotein
MQVVKATALALGASVTLSACATKGFVREQVGELRGTTEASLAQERSARMAGDSALQVDIAGMRGDIAALRGALDTLRNEFSVKISALENGMRFAMPVHFGFNESGVRDTDQAVLNRFADVVKKYYPSSTITVEGFADPAGSSSYNRRLSLKRAQSVRSYLTDQGLPTDKLRAVGYGEARQVQPGATGNEPGAELNRRVVFVIESGEQTVASAE